MRRRYGTLKRRKHKILMRNTIITMVVLTLGFATGYSAFSTNISLNAKGNIKKMKAYQLLKTKVVTSGDGLYRDIYETDRYIYKGANPDNYIIFSGSLWRIYSVESDGTLKIIKNDVLETPMVFDVAGNRNSETSTFCTQASTYGCNAYGIMNQFSTNSSNTGTVVKNSIIADYLINTYLPTLQDRNYIANNKNWYVGYATGGIEHDMDTHISHEKSYTWTGDIGLLTSSEYLRANNYDIINNTSLCLPHYALYSGGYTTCRDYNYLYDSAHSWRFITPLNDVYQVWCAHQNGNVTGTYARTESYYVRPVVYLKTNIYLTGNGEIDTPYELAEN